MNIFSDLENDTIRIVRSDGQVLGKEHKCIVNRSKIQTFDVTIEANEGDFIERILSNGRTEKYLILESLYNAGLPPIPPSYEFKVRNVNSIPMVSPSPTNNTYNLNGHNARVLNNSIDYSKNVVNITNNNIFDELRTFIKADLSEAGLLPLVDEMEQARGSDIFITKYNNFIQSAANHITVLAPFLPALTAMLVQGHSL